MHVSRRSAVNITTIALFCSSAYDLCRKESYRTHITSTIIWRQEGYSLLETIGHQFSKLSSGVRWIFWQKVLVRPARPIETWFVSSSYCSDNKVFKRIKWITELCVSMTRAAVLLFANVVIKSHPVYWMREARVISEGVMNAKCRYIYMGT